MVELDRTIRDMGDGVHRGNEIALFIENFDDALDRRP
jgi:hypothetical protein